MDSRSTYSNWAFGFLAGGLVGAGVALLLAPQSGEATRAAMRNKLREAADSARGLRDRVVHQAEGIRDETTRRVGAAASALAGHAPGNGGDAGTTV
jgi:gas vesicle protein